MVRLRSLPGADTLRWTGTPGWHYTLAFLGEVDEDLLPDLYGRLERAAHRTEAFGMRVHGGGRFDGRALWAGARARSTPCGCWPSAPTPPRAGPGYRWRSTAATPRT